MFFASKTLLGNISSIFDYKEVQTMQNAPILVPSSTTTGFKAKNIYVFDNNGYYYQNNSFMQDYVKLGNV